MRLNFCYKNRSFNFFNSFKYFSKEKKISIYNRWILKKWTYLSPKKTFCKTKKANPKFPILFAIMKTKNSTKNSGLIWSNLHIIKFQILGGFIKNIFRRKMGINVGDNYTWEISRREMMYKLQFLSRTIKEKTLIWRNWLGSIFSKILKIRNLNIFYVKIGIN